MSLVVFFYSRRHELRATNPLFGLCRGAFEVVEEKINEFQKIIIFFQPVNLFFFNNSAGTVDLYSRITPKVPERSTVQPCSKCNPSLSSVRLEQSRRVCKAFAIVLQTWRAVQLRSKLEYGLFLGNKYRFITRNIAGTAMFLGLIKHGSRTDMANAEW